MCGVGLVSCRLCLSPDILPPYLDLSQDLTGQVGDLSSLLGLDLADCPPHLPGHVCAICLGTLQSFQRLREVARTNDRLLRDKQLAVKSVEVTETEASDDGEDSSSQPGEEAKDEEEEPLAEDIKERKPVVISVVKQERRKKMCCDICGPDRLMTKHQLSIHMKRVHGTKQIKCIYEDCPVRFVRVADMNRHVRQVHHGQKTVCPVCGESFKNIREHVKIKHESERISCPDCDKTYYTQSGLQYHLSVVHLQAKKTVCHICSGEFRDMKAHLMYQHGGGKEEKSVPCRVAGCGKMFRTSQGEGIHYNATHLNLKQNCSICGGWFKNLSVHITQVHKNSNKYPCERCGKRFSKKCDLKLHVERVHLQKRYKCPECGKTISKIREHLRTVHRVTEINMENIQTEQMEETPS